MTNIKINKDSYLPYENILLYMAYTHNSIKEKVRYMKKNCREKIMDLTSGKKILSVIFLKDGTVILLNTTVETLHSRMKA